MPSAYSSSTVGQQQMSGKKERRAAGWDNLMSMTFYMGHHSYLPALALQDQTGVTDHPCRGEHRLLSCVRRLTSMPRKTRVKYVIQVFPTDMQEIPHAWTRGDWNKICIWFRPYARDHPLGSHRNRKHLKLIFVLLLQCSPPLSSTELLHTLIRLRIKVCLPKVWAWVCHQRFTYTLQTEMGQLLYFLVIEQEIPCSLLSITWKRNPA